MDNDPLSGTGFNKYDAGTELRMGVVTHSNVGEGTCRVETKSGQELDRVRVLGIGGGASGTGFYGMPTPRTRCVVLMTRGMFQENVLVGTFPSIDNEDRKTQVGPSSELLPGMVMHNFEDGGRFLLSPSGFVDIKAHPLAHRSYIPSEHLIKERVRNFERQTGPHDFFRRFSSTKEENTFLELMLNDRFLYRESDETPPIKWTLGDNTRGDVSPFNPQSPFLHFYEIEHRSKSSSDPIGRYKQEIGHVDGVVSRETLERFESTDLSAEHIREVGEVEGVLVKEQTKNFESTDLSAEHIREVGEVEGVVLQEETTILDGGDPVNTHLRKIGNLADEGVVSRETSTVVSSEIELTSEKGHFEGSDGKSVVKEEATKEGKTLMSLEIRDNGFIHLENPSWTVDIEDGTKATINNGETTIEIDAEEITIGAGSDEQMVIGNTMVDLLNEVVDWCLQHTHPTPVGPSGPPITASQLTAIQQSYKLTAGEKAKILSKTNFVSEDAS